MLRPSCRTRRAMRPAVIIGFGLAAQVGRAIVMTSDTRSKLSQAGGRRARRARGGAPVGVCRRMDPAVEVDRPPAVVHLRPGAAMGVVTENHAAAARDLE